MGKAIFLRSVPRGMGPIAFGIAVVAVGWAAAPGTWLYDDASAILGNGSLHSWSTALMPPVGGSPVAGRPLLNLSFALDWAVGERSPGIYLGTNLVIHWLAVCTLWGLLRRTAGAAPWAFLAALGWAVHPLGLAAVGYISQRAEALAALCCLFALYALARGWRTAAVAVCAAGMAVKETMVVAPVILWIYDGAFLAKSPKDALRQRPGFYGCLALTWLALAGLVIHEGSRNGTAGFGSGVSAFRYAALQGAAVLHYLRLAVWPHPLLFMYPRDFTLTAWNWTADGICLALLAASMRAYAKGPRPAGFLALTFFLWLAPSSSILPISTEIAAEHRMYLPLAAAITLAAAAIYQWIIARSTAPRKFEELESSSRAATDPAMPSAAGQALPRDGAGALGCLQRGGDVQSTRRELLAAVAAAGVIAAWGFVAVRRARDYSDAVRMWQVTARTSPNDPLVWNNVGTSRLDAGDARGAVAALDRSLELRPAYAEGHLNRGLALIALDRVPDAAAEFEAALRLSPGYEKARQNAGQSWLLLGNRAAQAGNRPEALRCFTRAVAANPADPYAHRNRGVALAVAGRTAEAIQELELAAAALPEDAALRHNLEVLRRRPR